MFWPSRISPRHQFDIILVIRLFVGVAALPASMTQARHQQSAIADVEIMLIMKCTFASEETVERKKGENEEDGVAHPVCVRSSHLALLKQHMLLHHRVILAESKFAEQRTQKGQNRRQKSLGERPEGENRDNSARRHCRGGRSRSFLVASSLVHV